MTEPTTPDGPLLAVRATVNLPWIPVGTSVLVDPTLPHVAAALEAQYLVPLPANQQPDASEATSAADPTEGTQP